jgi:hypothetical protein
MKIVEEAKPKLCLITHFGTTMLNANPEKQADIIEKKTGVRTIAAQDGQQIDLKNLSEKQAKLDGVKNHRSKDRWHVK